MIVEANDEVKETDLVPESIGNRASDSGDDSREVGSHEFKIGVEELLKSIFQYSEKEGTVRSEVNSFLFDLRSGGCFLSPLIFIHSLLLLL